MVIVIKEVCGNPPSVQTLKEYYCDSCGARCHVGGTNDSCLYEYDGEELCFECLWDILCGNVFRVVE